MRAIIFGVKIPIICKFEGNTKVVSRLGLAHVVNIITSEARVTIFAEQREFTDTDVTSSDTLNSRCKSVVLDFTGATNKTVRYDTLILVSKISEHSVRQICDRRLICRYICLTSNYYY